MMAALASIILGPRPGALHPQPQRAVRGALSLVEVLDSPSIFFTGMAGSRMPIAVAAWRRLADLGARRRGLGAIGRCASSTTPANPPKALSFNRTAALRA